MRSILIMTAVSLLAAPPAGAAGPPNVVLLLADDLGWTDLSVQGSRYYETPHIDRLAAGGMRFPNAYSAGPNCQPTRAALMTGQYGPRTGIYTVGGADRFDSSMRPLVPVPNVTKLAPAKTTIAEALKKAGYATGMFGKWHLGNDPRHHPSAQGFDEAIESSGVHVDFDTTPRSEVPAGAYLADYLTDKAVDFISRHKDRRFFVFLSHFAVHAPHQAKPELTERFRKKPAAGGHRSAAYAAMIASLDESVGRVMAKLDELQLSDKTMVIFSSDNGGVGGYRAAGVAAREGVTDNAPLRGGKGMLYEGGVRVPFIASLRGAIRAGAVCGEPIASVDLFPTLLDLAGAPAPEGQPLDGVSLRPLLYGEKASLGRDALFWHFPGYLGSGRDVWRTTPAGAIRSGANKLLEFFEDGRIELYDVERDPGEKRNLAQENPALARNLHAELKAWREAVKAPMPSRKPAVK